MNKRLVIIIGLILSLSVMVNAGEMKIMQVSPKVKIIQDEEGKGANLRVQNKKVQFIDEKGKLKKELDLTGQENYFIAISLDKKKIAFASNWRWRYSDEERKEMVKMERRARKKGEKYTYPKDLYRILHDIVIYDEDGNKVNTIKADFRIYRLYCSDRNEIVAFGFINRSRYEGDRGLFRLVFYDEQGRMLRSIDEDAAREKEIAIEGHGEIYQGDKIIWVGALVGWDTNKKLTIGKGGAITLFDLKGNIIWQYNDEHLSVFWLDIKISSDNNRFYIKAAYRDYKNPAVKKIWVLDNEGNLLKLLDGWEHEIK